MKAPLPTGFAMQPKDCKHKPEDCRITITPKFDREAAPARPPIYDGTGMMVTEEEARMTQHLSCHTCGLEWDREVPRLRPPSPPPHTIDAPAPPQMPPRPVEENRG